ncbi:hypothetical protein [Mobiluncus curtisii]|uniref:hypothetical protein n=2 Tax=Mobiluncus curtisii TaxID=2051 RepID=UPI0014703A58|nr:hypothetical protein [Mobiluncus curtisii]NMW48929.1 hypothetical protein [Mobiluncus curtisii]
MVSGTPRLGASPVMPQPSGRIRFTIPVARIMLLPASLLLALSWEARNTSVVLLTALTVLTVWRAARRWGTLIVWGPVVVCAAAVFVERFQPAYGTVFATITTLLLADLCAFREYAASGLLGALRRQPIIVIPTGVVGERELLQGWICWAGQAMWGLPYARTVINLAAPTPIVVINGSRNVTISKGHVPGFGLMLAGRNLSLDCGSLPPAGPVHDFLAGARLRRARWGLDMVRAVARTVDVAPTRLRACR